jgi:23S rRNA pseudouridine2605 synthase
MARKQAPRAAGLARALSKQGYCSRSQAAELIRAGRVRLNGKVRRDPDTPVHSSNDRILVDDHAVEPQAKIYLMLNKPRGQVTTTYDEKGRDTVYAALGGVLNATTEIRPNWSPSEIPYSATSKLPWVAPVGRLDKASEGLLLLTNDSEWASRVTDPETHLEKAYHVQIGTLAEETLLDSLADGVEIEAGTWLRVKRVRVLRRGNKNCWLEMVLDEGKNRHIRRMLAALNVEVLRLVRVAIGPLQLAELAKGAFRPLSKDEKRLLDRAMQRPSMRTGR